MKVKKKQNTINITKLMFKIQDLKKEINKARIKKCHAAFLGNCNNVINAHSIQKAKALKIVSNGTSKVMTPSLDVDQISKKMKLYYEVGIKKASTFTGFCSFHDNNLFKNFENSDIKNWTYDDFIMISFRTMTLTFHNWNETEKLINKNPKKFLPKDQLISRKRAQPILGKLSQEFENYKKYVKTKKSKFKYKVFNFEYKTLLTNSFVQHIFCDWEGTSITEDFFLVCQLMPNNKNTQFIIAYNSTNMYARAYMKFLRDIYHNDRIVFEKFVSLICVASRNNLAFNKEKYYELDPLFKKIINIVTIGGGKFKAIKNSIAISPNFLQLFRDD